MLGKPSRTGLRTRSPFSLTISLSVACALLLSGCTVSPFAATNNATNSAADSAKVSAKVSAKDSAASAPQLSIGSGAPAPLPPRAGAAFPTSSAPEGELIAEAPTTAAGAADGVQDEGASTAGQGDAFAPADQPTPLSLPTPTAQPAPLVADEPVNGPVQVALSPALPGFAAAALRAAIEANATLDGASGAQPLSLAASLDAGNARIDLAGPNDSGFALAQRYFAVVVPFDTVQDDIALDEVIARWDGSAPVYTDDSGLNWLPALLGQPAVSTKGVDPEALIGLLEENRDALGIILFEQIDPRFKVLTVDGVSVLSNQLREGEYPLVAQVKVSGEGASQLLARLGDTVEPVTNRDPGKLTTLVMTGVTAMARGTAAAIERAGDPAYPARVIGPELALANITHVSNEIPFIEGCMVNNTENNLQLCSDPSYWAALELMGTDIVGLSGNHVNDFGRDGARESLGWYKENKIPVYGSGLTVDSACAPLLWESNGNTFAFIAALAYGPESAWVTEVEPGSCYYYEHKDRIINTVATLSKAVDIVAVELQYEETYFAYPTPTQVEEFRELRAAGADLVTGVQSHVPQAQEPYGAYDDGDDGMISYGLGNLFFDQMWSWETRTELYARHAIYDGRLINTEILTGVLEDYAQPRWTTPEERADLLQTIFDGAPDRP